jgi:hypothetical protein
LKKINRLKLDKRSIQRIKITLHFNESDNISLAK